MLFPGVNSKESSPTSEFSDQGEQVSNIRLIPAILQHHEQHNPSRTPKPMNITTKTIRQIATLSRLQLEEDELEQFREDLSQILDWMGQLESVDTDGVDAFTGMGGSLLDHARDDSTAQTPSPDVLLSNAPERVDDFFTVPKILE